MNGNLILHQAYDAIDAECDPVLAATVRGMLAGYHARWCERMHTKELRLCEQTLVGPLANIQTGRKSRTWRVAGKIDKLVLEGGELVLYDHKTTSMPIHDPSDVYWRTLQVDSQHQHYYLLCWLNGIKVDRIVWDVVRKPTIRPKKLAKKDRAAITGQGEYCGFKVSTETRDLMLREKRENAELFELRIASEYTNDPDKYFARRSVVRTNEEFAEYCRELWEVAIAMRKARAEGSHYRNPGACMTYGRPCVFLGICSGHDSHESDQWKAREDLHGELDGIEERDAKGLITNSRLKSFLTCRRKHYYEYELGIEKHDPDEAEALYFGHVWHAAVDVYWQQMCRNHSSSHEGVSHGHQLSNEAAVG